MRETVTVTETVATVTGHVARPTGALPRRLGHTAPTTHDLPAHTHDLSRRSPPRTKSRALRTVQYLRSSVRTVLKALTYLLTRFRLAAHATHTARPAASSARRSPNRYLLTLIQFTALARQNLTLHGRYSTCACSVHTADTVTRMFSPGPPGATSVRKICRK